ncbi:MAG TPA: NAD-dependent epimerase/dehydratase family protein [Acidimicrobiales bacterium]|nr:NAD-dependent epimerase/dehydratase family protein [Acidimicrobiales bacterium]
MKLLVIGGTVFLGRHVVDAALAAGHQVTLANRGRTNAELYPEVERRVVDRDGDISALQTGEWDAVIDTCGYVPGHVRPVAELLRDRVGHYNFISSVSVYVDVSRPGVDEDSTVRTLADPTATEVTGETYGPLKVLCEEVVREVYGERACVVRPGLIVGPYDPSDRFTYWPRRFDLGGDAIVPDWKDMPVQLADARDLSEWMVRLAEGKTPGVFNGCGPLSPWRLEEVVDACVRAAGDNAATPVWVQEQFLLDHDVAPWAELPVWVPSQSEHAGMLSVSVRRAVDAGLSFRSVDEVVADTLEWDRQRRDVALRGPLTAEKEAALLSAWKEQAR